MNQNQDNEIEYYPNTNIPINFTSKHFIKKYLYYNEKTKQWYYLLFTSILGFILALILFIITFKIIEMLDLSLDLSLWMLLIIVPTITFLLLLISYAAPLKYSIKNIPIYVSIPILILVISQVHIAYNPLVEQHYYQIAALNNDFNISCEIIDEFVTQTNESTLQYHYTANLDNQTETSFKNIQIEVKISRGITPIDIGEYGIFDISTDFPHQNTFSLTSLPSGVLTKSGIIPITKQDVQNAKNDLNNLFEKGKNKTNKTIHPIIYIKDGQDIEKNISCNSDIDWYKKLNEFIK